MALDRDDGDDFVAEVVVIKEDPFIRRKHEGDRDVLASEEQQSEQERTIEMALIYGGDRRCLGCGEEIRNFGGPWRRQHRK